MQKFKRRSTWETRRCTMRRAAELGEFEGNIIQIGRGKDEGSIEQRVFKQSSLWRVAFSPKALVCTAQPKGFVTFIPLNHSGALTVNGVQGPENCIFLNTRTAETEILAANRNLLAGSVPTRAFLAKFAALLGRKRVAELIPSGLLNLTQHAHWRLVHQLTNTKSEQNLVEILAQAVAGATRPDHETVGSARKKARLVANAREWVRAQTLSEIHLSELCLAVGVSAPTLTSAFSDVTGLTPMQYLRRVRLEKSRETMLRNGPIRGAVKDAALSQGFTELGRFSAQYRLVYGELPSETLARLR